MPWQYEHPREERRKAPRKVTSSSLAAGSTLFRKASCYFKINGPVGREGQPPSHRHLQGPSGQTVPFSAVFQPNLLLSHGGLSPATGTLAKRGASVSPLSLLNRVLRLWQGSRIRPGPYKHVNTSQDIKPVMGTNE